MKNSLKFLAALLAASVASAVAQAQTAVKLALVDVAKAWESHYSLPDQNERMKQLNEKAAAELDRLMKEGQGLVEKFRELQEQARSPLLKDDAREKLAKEGEALEGEIQKKEEEVQAFRQSASGQINSVAGQFRNALVEQITKAAVEIAKKKGATLLIDRSGLSGSGFPPILFADASYDITEEVIAEVNKGKPASVAKPAAAAPAAAAPTPAPTTGGASPAVSFPGAKK